ncbi:alpha/beta hydrolase [Flavobacterium sp. CYK-4]|uniref:alpha/beta fold hydrolase n=1 Tax=Flavobacterium lotistagni TaxID=2709660 RepID=UPI00140A8450|nr:alpha/beta hydrolase [Flavobacterium lotistagni]NHM07816.1 alpha/beta hydrolase [Flavobacterium lotistagni]
MKKLLLLHGALGSQRQFDSLKKILSVDFELYSLDFYGHGDSEIVDKPFTIEGFARQVLDFMQQHQLEKTAVFGYSMGGYVGLYLAKHHPEKVEKLFILATKWDWNLESAAQESKMLRPEIIKDKVPKYAAYLESLHGKKWERLLEKTAAMMLALGNLPPLKQEDLRTIQTETLLAVGDKDMMVSLEETAQIFRGLNHSQLLVLPNTPHPIDRIDTQKIAYQISQYFNEQPS